VNDEAKRALQNKDLMYYLYHIKGMSIKQIAKLYGCSHGTVRNSLIRLGIELRPSGGVALEADLTPSPELVHLVFALKGDGHVGLHNREGYVSFASIDKVLVDVVRDELFKTGLHPNVTKTVTNRISNSKPKPFYRLRAYSKLFAEYYLSLTPQGLLELGLLYPRDALRALIETEGSVLYIKNNSLVVTVIYNTDLTLIHVARELLTTLGYKSSIIKGGVAKSKEPKPYYQLYLLGSTPQKEAFLNKLKPCVKWPVKAKG